MIYIFGNSHAHIFTNSKPGTFGIGENVNNYFTSFSLGPVISYNFFENHYSKILNIISNINFDIENDYILLAVGEVDCRWHLPNQSFSQNKSHETIVNECIDRLFRTHLDLKSKGYKVIGWGGHPSTTSEHNDDINQPVFGDCLTRNKITKLWDKFLQEKCIENNIDYITIVDELIDESGLTKMDNFIDYCHLDYEKTKNLILSKFKEKKIIK